MFKRSLLVAAVCAMVSLSALAGGVFPANVANQGTISVGSNPPQDRNNIVRDDLVMAQVDFMNWFAVVWDEPMPLNRVIVQMTSGYVIPSYEIQISTVKNPDATTDADWDSLGTFSSLGYSFAPGTEITGVRVKPLDYGSFGVARISHLFAYTDYNNVAPQAAFSAHRSSGWPVGGLSDEFLVQVHNGSWPNPTSGYTVDSPDYDPYIYATFTDTVTLAGSCVVGGSGAAYEYIIGYDMEYFDYTIGEHGGWVLAGRVTDNYVDPDDYIGNPAGLTAAQQAAKFARAEFDPQTSDKWRILITETNDFNLMGGTYGARISEIMLYAARAPIPEPATMTLLALGGLALRRRRRGNRL